MLMLKACGAVELSSDVSHILSFLNRIYRTDKISPTFTIKINQHLSQQNKNGKLLSM